MKSLRNPQSGYTLLELMIVVGIIAIIASVAVPSYQKQIDKTNRSDAKVALLKYAQIQESFFVQNLSYAKSLQDEAGGLRISASVQSENDLYDITLAPIPANCDGDAATPCTGFNLRATAIGGQLTDDTCNAFEINNLGRKQARATSTSPFTVPQGDICW